jgi:acyl-CoA thioesterase FadM
MDYRTLEAAGAITVAVNLNLNFRRECSQGDRLRVVTRPERLGNTSFAVKQEIVRDPGGEVVADAVFTIVTIDPATRRPRTVPEPLARAFRPADAPG